jgi:hypothetical protein
MISRTGNGYGPNAGTSCDSWKNQINALIRSNSQLMNYRVADIAEFPGLGADGAYANPTNACSGAAACFQGDGVHPTDPGGISYAAALQPILTYLTGYTASSPNTQTGTTYSMTPADAFVVANITGAAAYSLPPCLGLTGDPRTTFTISNTGTAVAVTMSGVGGSTIAGSTIVAAGTTGVFLPTLVSPSAGGCNWLRIQ